MAKAKHDDVIVLEKCPTGIKDLDEITKGGLPNIFDEVFLCRK